MWTVESRKGIRMKYYRDVVYGHNDILPFNRPIWGLNYSINNETEYKDLICLPVLGEIVDRTGKFRIWSSDFVPYKKGTSELRKSGMVSARSRIYADTYEEAVEMYNELVQKRIDNLYRMINEAEKDKIV